MPRINILRSFLRTAPIIAATIGVAAAAALGWFSYRYIYRTITTAQASSLLQPPLAVELVDPKRIEAADAFLKATAALPRLDPSTIRDVFSAQLPTTGSQPQTQLQRRRP